MINHLCSTVAIAFHSIGDYTHASDCFCEDGEGFSKLVTGFRHDGETLEYVRKAVIEQLKRDGYKVRHDPDIKKMVEEGDEE